MKRIGRASGILAALMLASWLAAPAPAGAEVYRWVDESGALHFASDLNKVPARYRAEARARSSEGAPSRNTRSTINRVKGDPDRQEALRKRVDRLRRSNELAEKKEAAKAREKTRAHAREAAAAAAHEAAKPTRKYRRDCSRRNANGRCARVQTREFRKWKAGQDR